MLVGTKALWLNRRKSRISSYVREVRKVGKLDSLAMVYKSNNATRTKIYIFIESAVAQPHTCSVIKVEERSKNRRVSGAASE